MLSKFKIRKWKIYSRMDLIMSVHPVGSIEPLIELVFLHKEPDIKPINLFIAHGCGTFTSTGGYSDAERT